MHPKIEYRKMDMRRKHKVILCAILILCLIFIYCFGEKNEFPEYISERLQKNDIAVCQLHELTDFTWDYAQVNYSGILMQYIEFIFYTNTNRNNPSVIKLSRTKYSAYESYVAHSPIGKELYQNSYVILSKYRNRDDDALIRIQILSKDASFFCRNISILSQTTEHIELSELAPFPWTSLDIRPYPHQYVNEFIYDTGIKYTLPINIVDFDGKIDNDSKYNLSPHTKIKLKFNEDRSLYTIIFIENIDKE